MTGETNLETLLNNLNPVLNTGDFVFCTVPNMDKIELSQIIGSFKEAEGITLILSKAYADIIALEYSSIMSWITLQVHSSLEAVGLTAAFSKLLAVHNISCNVVAGYYHDHLFVMKEDAKKAMELLSDFNK
jgi:hypothetical protein